MLNKATDIFSNWASLGKDKGMERNHNNAVETMLEYLVKKQTVPFEFIDAGCGNGWVVRKMRNHPLCKRAIGVDGAEGMIQNAKEIDSEGDYFFQDLMLWSPKSKVDFIHSMEVLYYFKNPKILISHMLEKWLKPNGRIISGVDYYLENETSHSWPKDLNTQMKLLSIQDWKDLFENCGLMEVEVFQTNASNSFSGTLIISGINKSI